MRCAIILGVLVTWWGLAAAGGQTTRPIPPEPRPRTQPANSAWLAELERRELGELCTPAVAERLPAARDLLERYFQSSKAEQRRQIVTQLEELGLDANLLGRVVRLRRDWPAIEGGIYSVDEKVGPHAVAYYLGVPRAYDRSRAWPLVVKLPAARPFAAEPPPTREEVAALYKGWIEEELRLHPDAVILMPVMNIKECWGPSYPGMNAAMQPVFHVVGRLNIDPARVYLSGQSMCAQAAWNLGMHYTTYLAAINPLAGTVRADWQILRLQNFANVLPVVWHDSEDKIIPIDQTRTAIRLLRQYKYNVEFEETKGVGHVPTDEIAEHTYKKMCAFTRELYPRQVAIRSNRPDTIYNRIDWAQVYQPLTAGAEKRLRFTVGSGTMMVNQYPFTLVATNAGQNRFELQAVNVQTLRLYFNDRMVDFTRPVVIRVNNRVRFEGMLKPSIDEMLKDQLFLGRGWRYFAAVVDLDLGESPTTAPATQPR